MARGDRPFYRAAPAGCSGETRVGRRFVARGGREGRGWGGDPPVFRLRLQILTVLHSRETREGRLGVRGPMPTRANDGGRRARGLGRRRDGCKTVRICGARRKCQGASMGQRASGGRLGAWAALGEARVAGRGGALRRPGGGDGRSWRGASGRRVGGACGARLRCLRIQSRELSEGLTRAVGLLAGFDARDLGKRRGSRMVAPRISVLGADEPQVTCEIGCETARGRTRRAARPCGSGGLREAGRVAG